MIMLTKEQFDKVVTQVLLLGGETNEHDRDLNITYNKQLIGWRVYATDRCYFLPISIKDTGLKLTRDYRIEAIL